MVLTVYKFVSIGYIVDKLRILGVFQDIKATYKIPDFL